MFTPANIASNGTPPEDTMDRVQGLLHLCTPVTVTLTRLTMREINRYRRKTKRRRKKIYSTKRQNTERRMRQLSKGNTNEGIKSDNMGAQKKDYKKYKKVKDVIHVKQQNNQSKKTGLNNKKEIVGVTKTDTPMQGKDKKVQDKRKSKDAVEKVDNHKRQRKMPVRNVAKNLDLEKSDLSTENSMSTVSMKGGSQKRILNHNKSLHVSLKKLEDINSDTDIGVWTTKALTKKPLPTQWQRAKVYSLRKYKGSTKSPGTELNSQEELGTKSQSSKEYSLRNHREYIGDPIVVATRLDSPEGYSTMCSVTLNNEHTKSKLHHYLDETLGTYENDDEQDLIDEIKTLTDSLVSAKEIIRAQDKTHDVSSPQSPPTYSPILGKSTARKQTKRKFMRNLQNKRRTANEISIEQLSTRPLSRAGQYLKYSRSVSVLGKPVSVNFEDSESEENEEVNETTKNKSKHLKRARRRPITRSLSRMGFRPPSSDSSRSPSPETTPVPIESTSARRSSQEEEKPEPVKRVRVTSTKHRKGKRKPHKGQFKKRTATATVDATNIADPSSVQESSSTSASIPNEDRLCSENAEHSKSPPSTYSPSKNVTTASIQEASSKSREPSPARSPFRASISNRTSVSPNKTITSSITETTCPSSICVADTVLLQDKRPTESDMESSEDEDSIELVIDEDPIKDGSDLTPSTLPLSCMDKQFSFDNFDQDQVVPMHETLSEYSSSNAETDVCKIRDNLEIIEEKAPKRAKSMAPTKQSTIADDLQKTEKSGLKLLPTRRMNVLGRTSLNRTRGEKKSPSKAHSRSKHPSASSKCIVCDTEFKSFALLQEHLRTHSGRQSPSTSGILASDPCPVSMLDANAREQTFQDTGIPSTMSSKTVCSVESSSKGNEHEDSVSLPNEASESIVESDVGSTFSTNLQTSPKKSETRSPSKSTKSKEKKFRFFNTSNICSICSHTFESKEKLADHIYSHTEEDLQAAYASVANTSSEVSEEASKQQANVKSANQSTVVTTINIEAQEIDTGNASSNTVSEETEINRSKAAIVQDEEEKQGERKSDSKTPKKSSQPNSSPKKKVAKSSPSKGATPKKNHSKEKKSKKSIDQIEVITLEEPEKKNTTVEKEHSPRKSIDGNTPCDVVVGVTKPITVCECHKKDVTHGNNLRIEVSLLCHACRTVYRSMECFEVHYRLPQHAQCNKNRLHGRSPKLFCTNCGMIFSSIQDVRQHLELHARYNTCVSTDFRCNLCKVAFIGIGTLFYVHWSNHLKNPLYIASKLSFPKRSVFVLKRNKYVSASKETITDQFLYVAEYICNTCRQPFTTEADLEKHRPECKKLPKNKEKVQQAQENAKKPTPQNSTMKPTPKISAKKPIPCVHTEKRVELKPKSKIRLVCGICEHVFLDKLLFEKHAEREHNREPPKPQYICVALTTMNTVFSCSACSKMFGNLSELEDHWKTHTAKRERYMCKNCSKFHESLESFMEHAKHHLADPRIDEVSCKVIYHDTEFVCKLCQLGFDTKVTMNKHFEMHGVHVNWPNSGSMNTPLLQSLINPHVQPRYRTIAPAAPKEKEKPKEPESMMVKHVALTVPVEKRSEVQKKDTASNERHEAITSNGQEEAEHSEGELVIDCKEISEDDHLQRTRGKLTPDTLSIPTVNTRTTTGTTETPNAVENRDIGKRVHNGVASPSQNSEPPKKGFLRVKTMAELTYDTATSSHECFICKFVPQNIDALATHILEAHSSLSPEEIASYKQADKKQAQSNPQSSNQEQNNSENRPQTCLEIPADSEQPPMLLLNGRLVKFTVKSKPPEPYQRQKPTWHRSEDRPVPRTRLPKSASGYHKNLPACPSTRPQSSATHRLPNRNTAPPRRKEPPNPPSVLKTSQYGPAAQLQHDDRNAAMIPTTVYELEGTYATIPIPSTSGTNTMATQSNRQAPPEMQAEGYRCRICPQFRGASVSDYLLHELSAEHEGRKRRINESSSNVPNPLRMNYGPRVTEAPSNIPTSRMPSTHQQNQQQECVRDVYAEQLYHEPIIYVSPGQGDRIVNYAIPANVYVNTGMSQSAAPLNSQTLIMPNRASVYQPVVLNNPNGIAVMGNSGTYVQANFTCCFCAKTFINEGVLRHHINTHHPYVCTVCREGFGTAGELEAHKMEHPCAWG